MESISTPNKSRIYVHLNSSDRTRSNSTRSSPSDRNFRKLYPILKKRKQPYSQISEDAPLNSNEVSRNLRVRRVFSPSSVIDENGEQLGPALKYPIRGSSGSESAETIGNVLEDLGAENCGFDIKVVADEELNNISTADDGNRVNTRESVQNTVKLIHPNESSSADKQVVKPNLLRKVVKASSSFSYRRMLPYLMGLNSEESCTSEIKTDDKDLEYTVQNANEPLAARSDDSKPLQNGEIDNLGFKSPCKQAEQNCGSITLTQAKTNAGLHSVNNNPNGIDDATGGNVSMTPPDPDNFTKCDTNDYKVCTDQIVQQFEKTFLGNPLNPSNIRPSSNNTCTWKKSCQNPAERSGTSWKSQMVLTPCSRKKVLKPPCSVSYRRLLPYLFDVPNDSKDGEDVLKSKDSNQLNSEACTANSTSEVLTVDLSVPMSCSTSDSIKMQIPALSASVEHTLSETTYQLEPDLSNDIKKTDHGEVTRGGVPSNPIANAESLPKIPEISQLGTTNCEGDDTQEVCSEDNRHVDEIDVSNEVQPNTSTFAGIQTVVSAEPLLMESAVLMDSDCHGVGGNLVIENASNESSTETLPKDCNIATTIQPEHLENSYINCGTLVHSVTFNESQSEIQASNRSISQTEGTMKGVLKRNPRGCRGRCDCLNCASFRLHAERSFEFSKYQMQDAEEVALELIKELSDIRKLLESSPSNENNLALFEVAQVKEACIKALQAEQIAKERIGRMNDELHYHCRITPLQRPRVTFSIAPSPAGSPASPKNGSDAKMNRKQDGKSDWHQK